MTPDQMAEAQRLQREFTRRWDQSYVHIEFCDPAWSWGCVRFRAQPSGGQDGEISFHSPDELIRELGQLQRYKRT